MKYTSEYIYDKRIAIEFKTIEEALKIINLMGKGNDLKWGGIKAEKFNGVGFNIENGIIGRYAPDSKSDMSICCDGGNSSWYQNNGFEIITYEQFFADNNEITYEIY